jgi:curved DNA-binding protein CbpA
MSGAESLNHYQVLGVESNATAEEISKAYKREARVRHPDKNPEDEHATEKFQALQQAYDVLGNEDRRKLYDRQQGQNLQQSGEKKAQEIHTLNIEQFKKLLKTINEELSVEKLNEANVPAHMKEELGLQPDMENETDAESQVSASPTDETKQQPTNENQVALIPNELALQDENKEFDSVYKISTGDPNSSVYMLHSSLTGNTRLCSDNWNEKSIDAAVAALKANKENSKDPENFTVKLKNRDHPMAMKPEMRQYLEKRLQQEGLNYEYVKKEGLFDKIKNTAKKIMGKDEKPQRAIKAQPEPKVKAIENGDRSSTPSPQPGGSQKKLSPEQKKQKKLEAEKQRLLEKAKELGSSKEQLAAYNKQLDKNSGKISNALALSIDKKMGNRSEIKASKSDENQNSYSSSPRPKPK